MAELVDGKSLSNKLAPVDSKKLYRALEAAKTNHDKNQSINIPQSASSLVRPVKSFIAAKSKTNIPSARPSEISSVAKKESTKISFVEESKHEDVGVEEPDEGKARKVQKKVTIAVNKGKRTNTPLSKGKNASKWNKTCSSCRRNVKSNGPVKGFYAWTYQPVLHFHQPSPPMKVLNNGMSPQSFASGRFSSMYPTVPSRYTQIPRTSQFQPPYPPLAQLHPPIRSSKHRLRSPRRSTNRPSSPRFSTILRPRSPRSSADQHQSGLYFHASRKNIELTHKPLKKSDISKAAQHQSGFYFNASRKNIELTQKAPKKSDISKSIKRKLSLARKRSTSVKRKPMKKDKK